LNRVRTLLGLALAIIALIAAPAQAHDARPLAITITEQADGEYLTTMRVPPTVAGDNLPVLEWPLACMALPDEGAGLQAVFSVRQAVRCEGGIAGKQLTVSYPIYNPSLPTLFRLESADGSVVTQLLRPNEPEWVVPVEPSLLQVAGDYLRLGVEHIWSGIDHLLFVAGLLLLAGSIRRVLLAVTGFTIAHSITLSLAALDLVHLPIAPVEAAIALSILFLAREIVSPHPAGLAIRHPILVSSSFGLLHGFGFASVLQEIGLPTGELATGLLSFNIGVEIGQILFILAALALFWIVRKALKLEHTLSFEIEGRPRRIAGYALGIPAAFWFVERAMPIVA
jgi:hydrogenase/urease accessory protein HupE